MSDFSPFQPPGYSYGAGAARYVIMEVVNRDDPEQSGRLRCRVFGYQNDKGNIPDDQLLWARPVCSPTNPMNGGIATSPTGIMVGSWLLGFFADGNQQLFYTGSIGKAGKQGDSGKLDSRGRNHDTPPTARDSVTGGSDIRFDQQANNLGSTSIIEYAKNEAKAPSGRTTTLDGEESSWSLGTYPY